MNHGIYIHRLKTLIDNAGGGEIGCQRYQRNCNQRYNDDHEINQGFNVELGNHKSAARLELGVW